MGATDACADCSPHWVEQDRGQWRIHTRRYVGRRGSRLYARAVQPITGVVQHYAWGDHDFIPRLLGVEPDGRPWAELWLGTHPNGPATLADGRPLADVTGPLPYLLKVLAAAEPLSLQAHPDRGAGRSRASPPAATPTRSRSPSCCAR